MYKILCSDICWWFLFYFILGLFSFIREEEMPQWNLGNNSETTLAILWFQDSQWYTQTQAPVFRESSV